VALVGKVDLKADIDVKAGEELRLTDLFSWDEKWKEFTVESDIEYGKTRIKVNIPKVGVIETIADITRKKGERACLWLLMKFYEFLSRRKALQDISKGETLTITIETA